MIPKFEDEPFFHIPSSPENLHHDRNTIPNFIQEKEEKRKEREREGERNKERRKSGQIEWKIGNDIAGSVDTSDAL